MIVVAATFWPGVAGATTASDWSIQSTPNPAGSPFTPFSAVSCPSISQCTAVGGAEDRAGHDFTMAERWQGSRWKVRPTPNPNALASGLSGVSCTSPTACTAVGWWATTNTWQPAFTLAERWDGSSWTIQRTPSPPVSMLEAVSCVSATVCTATGHSYRSLNDATVVTLVERWNGTRWKVQLAPNPPGATASDLSAVSCTAIGACMAVGSSFDTAGSQTTLAERWDGKSWSILPVPSPSGAMSSALSGVSCMALNSCAVVGSYVDSAGTTATLAERWDGTSWAIQATPNPAGSTTSILSAVSCTTDLACTAVGFSSDSTGTQTTLAEHWDGASWAIQATPNPAGSTSTILSSVSCTTDVACTAVGYSIDSASIFKTLAERHS